jgi:hypothetical protein
MTWAAFVATRDTHALLLWLLGALLGAGVLAWPKRYRWLAVLLLTGCACWIGYALLVSA